MGLPCMESMQNKTLLPPPCIFFHKTYPTKLDIKRRGNINLWGDDRYSRGLMRGLWPSSPACSLCPSCPACLLQRSFTSARKPLSMPQKKRKKQCAWLLASDQRGVSKVAINQNQAVRHTKYHGVTSNKATPSRPL